MHGLIQHLAWLVLVDVTTRDIFAHLLGQVCEGPSQKVRALLCLDHDLLGTYQHTFLI